MLRRLAFLFICLAAGPWESRSSWLLLITLDWTSGLEMIIPSR